MTIAETTFALVDTETTGTDREAGAELVEVAVHRRAPDGAIERYSTGVFPAGEIPPETSAVHHLTIEDLIGCPTAGQVMGYLGTMIRRTDVMVAHNAPFDRGFLPILDECRWLCTERLAHHITPDAPNFKLQTLRYYFGFAKIDLEGQQPHRADADLIVLRYVLDELLRRYSVWCLKERGEDEERFARSQEVDVLLAYANRPYTIRRMPFGKHRGALLADVPKSYIRWALREADIDADLRWNLQRQVPAKPAKAQWRRRSRRAA
jgi:exodeoxyribonuclease X